MTSSREKATLVIVMGVSGCGKSTIAHALAEKHGFEFVEADDFHSQKNIQHMTAGKALTDNMREPWIKLIQAHLRHSFSRGRNCILSFSGLRHAHREKMRALDCNTIFIHLKGDQSLIAERIERRGEHFMPVSLLASQYAALECPIENERLIEIDISKQLSEVTADASQALSIALASLKEKSDILS